MYIVQKRGLKYNNVLVPYTSMQRFVHKSIFFFLMWNAKYETLMTMKIDIIFGCILGNYRYCVLSHGDQLAC